MKLSGVGTFWVFSSFDAFLYFFYGNGPFRFFCLFVLFWLNSVELYFTRILFFSGFEEKCYMEMKNYVDHRKSYDHLIFFFFHCFPFAVYYLVFYIISLLCQMINLFIFPKGIFKSLLVLFVFLMHYIILLYLKFYLA